MDSSARGLSAGAEKVLGEPIVIVTKDGGGGTVGLGVLANDKPDGYTIAAATTTGILRVPLRRKVPYKPLADFTPIIAYASVASATVVTPDSQFDTMRELIDYAKEHPGEIKYATAGAGSPMHLVMAYIGIKEGIEWIHVPFKGSAPAETALLGGHVDVVSTGDLDKAITGQLKTLCVHTKERMDVLPDAPTTIELGYDYYNDTMFAIYGPAGMDPEVVKTLEDAFAKAVDMEPFQKVAERFGLVPIKVKSAELKKFLEEGWPQQVELLTEMGLIEEPATEPR
jgi:tripartite-type tricarboxylate transporter receptor subunit TctC